MARCNSSGEENGSGSRRFAAGAAREIRFWREVGDDCAREEAGRWGIIAAGKRREEWGKKFAAARG